MHACVHTSTVLVRCGCLRAVHQVFLSEVSLAACRPAQPFLLPTIHPHQTQALAGLNSWPMTGMRTLIWVQLASVAMMVPRLRPLCQVRTLDDRSVPLQASSPLPELCISRQPCGLLHSVADGTCRLARCAAGHIGHGQRRGSPVCGRPLAAAAGVQVQGLCTGSALPCGMTGS